jgi:hypothetical protein
MEKEHKPVEQWKDHAHQTQAGATQETPAPTQKDLKSPPKTNKKNVRSNW